MTKSKQRQSLRGAVLIMILTVMVVLIIMLMATLTVVTTAGKRVYTKFEENQAYYTARSALDVFTNNLMTDGAYYAYGTSGKKPFKYVDTSDGTVKSDKFMKQGLALQLDLYKIKSQNEDGVDLGFAENPVKGDGTFPDIAPSVENPANEYYTLATAAGLDCIEYDITFPATSDGSNSYGKIVDVDKDDKDNDGDTTDQVARIKIEVLDRKLHMNPAYTDAEVLAAPTINPSDPSYAGEPTVADVKAAIAAGNRSKDYMKIKITSTVQMMDTEGVAVIIFETTEKDTPATDNALTTTGSFSGGSGAQVRTAGGAATMDIGVSAAGDGNNMSGTLFTLGQFEWVSSAATKLNEGEMCVAYGGIASSSNPTIIEATSDDTYVFLGGTSYLNNGTTFGAGADGVTKYNVPLIADKIVKQSDSQLTVNGDMYVNTLDYQAANNGKITVTGTAYVKNLILPDNTFFDKGTDDLAAIDLSSLGIANLKLCKDFTITVGSNVYKADNMLGTPAPGVTPTWEPYGMDSTTFAVTYPSTVEGFDIDKFTAEKKDDKIYRKYKLPFQVGGTNEIMVPTAQAYFGEYFKEDAFHETTGDLKNASDPTNDDPADANNDYSVIYETTNKNAWLMDAADMLEKYLELPELTAGAADRTITSMLTPPADASLKADIPNVLPMPTGSTVIINLDSGDKFYKLSGSYNNQNWNVTGSNGRLILLVEENATVKFDNCTITTDYINTTTATIQNGVTKAPRVDIYAGTGATIDTGNQNFFAAYFMMPTASVYMNNGKSNVTYTNGVGTSTNVNNVCIVGSLLCGDFTESNQSGIVYLNKDSGASTPGDPHLSVEAAQYARK